tara:strand:- start:406 stop:726 length:321 start_codon:yes stop_codon:yes gene_type:complete
MTKIYVETKEGSFSIEGMSIPAAEDNRHYQQMLEEVEAGEARLAPYVEPEKTNDQLIAEIDLELASLDATPRMLSGALLGDQWAKDQIADNEIKQSVLRESRKALI